jgi:aryl-alcohol dehydrogenase-like predicted oxidoreductase
MKYATLGNRGLLVSKLCFGTPWHSGRQKALQAIIRSAAPFRSFMAQAKLMQERR